ncbi:MAG: hemolysin III family protein, partial [Bacteroidota bacterium]|nr:hemolysin III family protein [Bacteroidota bacterium]
KEEFLNTLTHFFGLILTIIGIPFILYFNNNHTEYSLFSIILFLFGLLSVYLSSTIYHYTKNNKLKSVFRKIDHISIFYLILGSYAPVCLVTLLDFSGITIFLIVFTLAIIGTILKVFFTGKIEKASLLLYLVMGWLIISDISTLFSLIPIQGKILLAISGLSYTIGTLFYRSNKKYAHTIWHLFVLSGSITHYFFVIGYII